jgi:hypothetical protein
MSRRIVLLLAITLAACSNLSSPAPMTSAHQHGVSSVVKSVAKDVHVTISFAGVSPGVLGTECTGAGGLAFLRYGYRVDFFDNRHFSHYTFLGDGDKAGEVVVAYVAKTKECQMLASLLPGSYGPFEVHIGSHAYMVAASDGLSDQVIRVAVP